MAPAVGPVCERNIVHGNIAAELMERIAKILGHALEDNLEKYFHTVYQE